MHVMKYLKVESLVWLSAVNKDFHCVARQPILWRRLYVKDFGRKFLTAAFSVMSVIHSNQRIRIDSILYVWQIVIGVIGIG